jgi:hypothetical protein
MTLASTLLDDSYPHGTLEGSRRGCRGSHCPAKISCANVRIRYGSDYAFAKRIDNGWTLDQIIAAENAAATAERERERAAARATRDRQRARTPKLTEPKPTAERAPKPKKPKPSRTQRVSTPRPPAERAPRTPSADVELREIQRKAKQEKREAAREARYARVRELHGQGKFDAEIAADLGISVGRAWQLRTDLELPAHKQKFGQRTVVPLSERQAKHHGTPYGYALGCKDRSLCPGGADGVKCTDAASTAERERNRRNGAKPLKRSEHGTNGGYKTLACRLKDQCPSKLAGGMSCTEANTKARAEWKARQPKKPSKRFIVTDEHVSAIKERVLAKMTDTAIAAELGMVQSTVSKVRRDRLKLPANAGSFGKRVAP